MLACAGPRAPPRKTHGPAVILMHAEIIRGLLRWGQSQAERSVIVAQSFEIRLLPRMLSGLGLGLG